MKYYSALKRKENLTRATTCMKSESEVVSDSFNPMDCSLPGFSVHGIFQARVPEWVAISFSRGSSQCGVQSQVSRMAGIHFTL